MYTTKPLSLFKSYPEAAFQPPLEGRNSGYLVVDDAAADDDGTVVTCCWGNCCRTRVRELPFPQNRVLTVEYTEGIGEHSRTHSEDVVFVPVPDEPLASNRYYVVLARGKRKGLVRTCSREEDKTLCCCWMQVMDAKPRPFDPADVYQQMEVVPRRSRRGQFTARSVAADGIPYLFYREKYWYVYASKSKSFDLDEARGLDASHPSSHVLAGAPVPSAPTTTAVGKWYCPFFLIKEDGFAPRKQMDRGAFYEVTLQQRWEPVDESGCSNVTSKKAFFSGNVQAIMQESAGSSNQGDNSYVWFRAAATGQSVGLCASVWERMRWEENRRRWVDEEVDVGMVAGGLVLAERFVVKRMDGTVTVAFDFVHLRKVRAQQL